MWDDKCQLSETPSTRPQWFLCPTCPLGSDAKEEAGDPGCPANNEVTTCLAMKGGFFEAGQAHSNTARYLKMKYSGEQLKHLCYHPWLMEPR